MYTLSTRARTCGKGICLFCLRFGSAAMPGLEVHDIRSSLAAGDIKFLLCLCLIHCSDFFWMGQGEACTM